MPRTIKYVIVLLLMFASSSLWAKSGPANTATPVQKQLLEQLDTTTDPSQALLEKAVASLSREQLGMISAIAPGLKITPELLGKIYAIAYDTKKTVDQRGAELKALIGISKPGQYIHRTVCIWDPIGQSGPIFQAAMDQSTKARAFGIDLKLVPYTSEAIATADLKDGHCDAALISGLRARTLNEFTGTTDAIGGITTDQEMRTLLYVLSRPAMAKDMVQGPFVTMGIAQGGAAYVFVDDKNINTLGKAAGKKVAVLGYDPVQAEMVAQIGATPVPSTMLSAPNKFNNHVVDVLAAPLVAYNAMELYKGMSPNGGIIDMPLAQITIQLIGWRDKFPNVISQLIRESFFENYDKIAEALNNETKTIPKHWWIEIPPKDKVQYESMMQHARITLRNKGYYSGKMLTLERKIRCKYNPANSECVNPVE
jgi:hypothetical protein